MAKKSSDKTPTISKVVTFKASLENIDMLADFVKEFSILDDVLFVECLMDGGLQAKYMDTNASTMRYNKISDEIFKFEEPLEKRIGIGFYNLKKILGIFELLGKEKNISIEFECSEPRVKNFTDAYEAHSILIKSENFKLIKIPLANSSLITYVGDEKIDNLLDPSEYFTKLKFDDNFIKKVKGIVKLDESLEFVKIIGDVKSQVITFNFQDEYEITINTDVEIVSDFVGTFETEFIKKIKNQDYEMFIDDVKLLLISDKDDVLYAFTMIEDTND